MPRPLRPFAGRWSLVAAVLLPCGDSDPAPHHSHAISRQTPPSPARTPGADEEPTTLES